jgi:hypothetical protein
VYAGALSFHLPGRAVACLVRSPLAAGWRPLGTSQEAEAELSRVELITAGRSMPLQRSGLVQLLEPDALIAAAHRVQQEGQQRRAEDQVEQEAERTDPAHEEQVEQHEQV